MAKLSGAARGDQAAGSDRGGSRKAGHHRRRPARRDATPRAMPRRPVGRRGRRESEWYARLLLLSNRLTRYAYAGQQAVKREYERLLLADDRLADVVVAAHGIETSYVRIRPVTHAFALSPVGKAVGDKDVKGIDAVMVAARGRRL